MYQTEHQKAGYDAACLLLDIIYESSGSVFVFVNKIPFMLKFEFYK